MAWLLKLLLMIDSVKTYFATLFRIWNIKFQRKPMTFSLTILSLFLNCFHFPYKLERFLKAISKKNRDYIPGWKLLKRFSSFYFSIPFNSCWMFTLLYKVYKKNRIDYLNGLNFARRNPNFELLLTIILRLHIVLILIRELARLWKISTYKKNKKTKENMCLIFWYTQDQVRCNNEFKELERGKPL